MKSIAVNGIGTIGKRVADAVSAQDDMEIVGVCKTKPDFEAMCAIKKGYDCKNTLDIFFTKRYNNM